VGWLALLVLAHGCGYALVRTGGSLGGVHSVAIPTLRNDSWEPGAEYVVAEALRQEFLRRKAVRLVEDPSRADLVLRGRVSRVGTRTASVDSIVLALEYEITLELDLAAERSGGGEVPLDVASLRESERYLASADAEVTRKNRQEALRQVASVLAARVYVALRETLGAETGVPADPQAPAASG